MRRRAAIASAAGAEGVGSGRQLQRSAQTATHLISPKRQLILEGMLDAVGSVGYEAVTAAMVIGRTGSSRRAFDLDFEDEEDCYLAAFEFGVGKVESLLRSATRGEKSWLGQFRTGLGALLDFLDGEPEVGRALLVEVQLAGPEAQARADEAIERATDFIDLARLEADGSESPPDIAPRAVVAGIYGMLYSQLASETRGGFRKLMPDLAYYAVLPYFGAEVACRDMLAAEA